jgi:hypothetical protein
MYFPEGGQNKRADGNQTWRIVFGSHAAEAML